MQKRYSLRLVVPESGNGLWRGIATGGDLGGVICEPQPVGKPFQLLESEAHAANCARRTGRVEGAAALLCQQHQRRVDDGHAVALVRMGKGSMRRSGTG